MGIYTEHDEDEVPENPLKDNRETHIMGIKRDTSEFPVQRCLVVLSLRRVRGRFTKERHYQQTSLYCLTEMPMNCKIEANINSVTPPLYTLYWSL